MSLHAYEILEQSGVSSTYFGTGDMIVAETKAGAERLARKQHVYRQRIKAAKMSDKSGFAQRLIQKNNPGNSTKRLKNFTGTVTRFANGSIIVQGVQR